MNRFFFLILVFLHVSSLRAQPSLYRRYPQGQSFPLGFGIKKPVQTNDGGYILSYLGWTPALHYYYFAAPYTIKTDSNFVPQWKKPYYASAIQLASGAVILLYGSTIEKVSPSGAQIWIKHLSNSNNLTLNDGVCYGDKIRIVGRKAALVNVPYTTLFRSTSNAYTLLIDTSGTIHAESLFDNSMVITPGGAGSPYMGNTDFSKIKRDAQGNFYVYSNMDNLSVSDMSIAKFDSSFTCLWAKTWASPYNKLYLNDVDILPSGGLIAAGISSGTGGPSYPQTATLLKISASGNILSQKYFGNGTYIAGLCKNPAGNYVGSIRKADSLFLFEMDTSLNVSWKKYFNRGSHPGTPIVRGNTLFTPIILNADPLIRSHDLSGNSCSSYSVAFSLFTASVGLTAFTFSSVACSSTLVAGSTNTLLSQSYVDSCNCPVFVSVNRTKVCLGDTASVTVIGNGNLSWYSTASGNSFIQAGPQYNYTASSPGSVTVYAQDSTCASHPTRTEITLHVYGQPTLSFSPASPTICAGQQVFVTAVGANNYTWNGSFSLPGSSLQNLNPTVTTVYTVNASNAPGCTDTQTLGVFVVPQPTLTFSNTSACVGSTVTLSVTGANSYTWIALGSNASSVNIIPTVATNHYYTVVGSNNYCSTNRVFTLNVAPSPSISVAGPQHICSGYATTLIASGAQSYTWSNSATSASVVLSPSTNSTYSITGMSVVGCSAQAVVPVLVSSPPTLSLSSSGYSVCEQSTVALSVLGANSYTWSHGSHAGSFTTVVPYGHTTFSVWGSNGACNDTAVVQLHGALVPTLGLNITPFPHVLCLGKTYTIQPYKVWVYSPSTFTFDQVSVASETVITAVSDIDLVVTGANGGCVRTNTFHLAVYPNPTVFVAQSQHSICAGQSFSAIAAGGDHYNWNDFYWANSHTISLSPNMSTSYYLVGYNAAGCTDTARFSVTVHYPPHVQVSASDSVICFEEACTLSASGASTYSWSTQQSGTSIVVSPASNVNYMVVGTNAFGCNDTASVFLKVELCAGMADDATVQTFYVYPNPGNTLFYLRTDERHLNWDLSVFNAIGQIIQQRKVSGPESLIDLSEHAKGVYYLKLSGKQETLVQKILKQ